MATDEPPIDATAHEPETSGSPVIEGDQATERATTIEGAQATAIAADPSPAEGTPIEAEAPPASASAMEAGAPPAAPTATSVTPTAPPSPLDPGPDAFRPRPVRGALSAAFWAGLVGGGAGLWATGVYGSLLQNDLIEGPRPETFFPLCFLAALVFALMRGYVDPVTGYVRLLGRILGISAFGVLANALVVAVLVAIFEGNHIQKASAMVGFSLVGLAMTGLALRHNYGIGPAGRRRQILGAGFGLVLLVSIWPVSPGLRCRLGIGEGCRVAAVEADSARDAIRYGERGCAHDDARSCQIAAQAYIDGEGVVRNTGKALHLFRTACALGDARGCDRAHGVELKERCDRSSAVACRDLGAALRQGVEIDRDAKGATLAYRKACLLGASDACAEAGNR